LGEVQLPHDPESSLHWKVEPLSFAEKEKLAVVAVEVAAGPEVIVVSGAVVSAGGAGASTVQVRAAGEASTLPAPSVAFTEKVWVPTESPLYDFGEVHSAHDPESSLHWKLEPLSLELKPMLALVAVVVVAGPEPIVVSGAVVSAGGVAVETVQLRVAGELSTLPAASVALTAKV
jgi:hypothetical protein